MILLHHLVKRLVSLQMQVGEKDLIDRGKPMSTSASWARIQSLRIRQATLAACSRVATLGVRGDTTLGSGDTILNY